MQFAGSGGMGLFAGQSAGTPGGRTVVGGAAVVAGAVVTGAFVGGVAVVGTADDGEFVAGAVVGVFVGVGDGSAADGADGGVPVGWGDVVPETGPSLGTVGVAPGWSACPSPSLAGAPPVDAGAPDPGLLPGRCNCVGRSVAP